MSKRYGFGFDLAEQRRLEYLKGETGCKTVPAYFATVKASCLSLDPGVKIRLVKLFSWL